MLDNDVWSRLLFHRIEFRGKYIENRVEYSVAGVWAAEAHLMSWEMIWVEDTVLVFDLSKVLD